jgi:hypothetical protein
MRRMETLMDAGKAIRHDLPSGYLKANRHWLDVGRALVTAAEGDRLEDNIAAYEALVAALDREGWLTRDDKPVSAETPAKLPPVVATNVLPFARSSETPCNPSSVSPGHQIPDRAGVVTFLRTARRSRP